MTKILTILKTIWSVLKTIFSWLWTQLEKLLKKITSKGWVIILAVLCIFLLVLNIHTCTNKKEDTKFINADSIGKETDKAGNTYNVKEGPSTDEKALKDYDDTLYQEVANSEKNGETPIVVTKVVTKTQIKNVDVPTTVTKYPDRYDLNWNYANDINKQNYIHFSGTTSSDSAFKHVSTKLNNLEVASDLILDIVDNDKSTVKIKARSNNPYVSFTNITGAVVDPQKSEAIKSHFKPKKFGIGIQLGAGLQYDVNGKKVNPGPYIGVGFSYNFINF